MLACVIDETAAATAIVVVSPMADAHCCRVSELIVVGDIVSSTVAGGAGVVGGDAGDGEGARELLLEFDADGRNRLRELSWGRREVHERKALTTLTIVSTLRMRILASSVPQVAPLLPRSFIDSWARWRCSEHNRQG